jgi:DNA-binding beta-propeller fold protein YncE
MISRLFAILILITFTSLWLPIEAYRNERKKKSFSSSKGNEPKQLLPRSSQIVKRKLKGMERARMSMKGTKEAGQKKKDDKKTDDDMDCAGTIFVVNRADGTLSVLDSHSGELYDTIAIPVTRTMAQPIPEDIEIVNGLLYISDSANDRIVAIDAMYYHRDSPVANIPTGRQPTELSSDSRGTTLWVTNVEDNTVLVIDLSFRVPIRTIEAFDVTGEIDFGNNVVNDVYVSSSGDAGFVTYSGSGGILVRYDDRGAITAFNTDIGKNARITASFRFNCIFATSTSSNLVNVLFNQDLFLEKIESMDSPYDVVTSRDGNYLYITSTAKNMIYTWDMNDNKKLATNVTTVISKPWKLTHAGDRIFVTHRDSIYVSMYSVSKANPIPIPMGKILVGNEPFGIDYLPPTSGCSSSETSSRQR